MSLCTAESAVCSSLMKIMVYAEIHDDAIIIKSSKRGDDDVMMIVGLALGPPQSEWQQWLQLRFKSQLSPESA